MLIHLRRFHHQHVRALATGILMLCTTTLISNNATANPQDGQVVGGSASINQSNPANTVINQTSQKAIVNWRAFSINKGEQTTFVQPNAQAIALNRVVGVDPSKIMGTLKANGQVWLVNPNGILFGKTARVDVGGLLATTLNISNADFMAGNYKFYNSNNSGAMVVNEGQITVNDAGLAALVAPGVENAGVIAARLGKIQLGSASGFTVDLGGDGTFNFLLDKQMAQQLVSPDGSTVPSAAITNSGKLIADGGTILLTANTAKSVVDHAIDMSGYARAQGVRIQGGTIVLNGGDNGAVNVSGTLDASGDGGGTIKVLGGMQDGTVNVSGTLNASAPNGGNGGFIETSAAQVNVADSTDITTAAPYGKDGTWLIDPHNYTIAASGGNSTGTAISNQLANNNVYIASSDGSSGGSGNIYVNQAVSWSKHTLTLLAANDIYVNAVMTLSNSASLALYPITTNGSDTAVSTTSMAVVMGQNSGASSTDFSSYTGRIDFSGASPYTGTFTDNGVTIVSNQEFISTPAFPLSSGVDTSFLGLSASYVSNTSNGTSVWKGTSLWASNHSSFFRINATVDYPNGASLNQSVIPSYGSLVRINSTASSSRIQTSSTKTTANQVLAQTRTILNMPVFTMGLFPIPMTLAMPPQVAGLWNNINNVRLPTIDAKTAFIVDGVALAAGGTAGGLLGAGAGGVGAIPGAVGGAEGASYVTQTAMDTYNALADYLNARNDLSTHKNLGITVSDSAKTVSDGISLVGETALVPESSALISASYGFFK